MVSINKNQIESMLSGGPSPASFSRTFGNASSYGNSVKHDFRHKKLTDPEYVKTRMARPSNAWRQGGHGGKIPPEKALEIRRLLSMGVRQEAIARQMGVTQQCISKFKTGFRKT